MRFGKQALRVLIAAVVAGSLLETSPAFAQYTITNVIPTSLNSETDQSAEPSIAVNPANPLQVAISAFANVGPNPYFASNNGGAKFVNFDNIDHFDTTLGYSSSGKLWMATLDPPSANTSTVYKTTNPTAPTPFSGVVTLDNTPFGLDQPHIRAANVGGSDHVYVGINAFGSTNTATILQSLNSGALWAAFPIENAFPGFGQDGPAVRAAINGDRVYAGFLRWNSRATFDINGTIPASVVVTRSDNGGLDSFTALSTGLFNGTVADNTTDVFTHFNGVFTVGDVLGQERIGSNLTLAVDPNNADRVLVGYVDELLSGQVVVRVSESTDGGVSFTRKFDTTLNGENSALAALAVDGAGDVGLLYTSYDAGNDLLKTHFLLTRNDFVTTTDNTIFSFNNSAFVPSFDPYIGDFQEVEAVSQTFYGTFSASNDLNAADGTSYIVTPAFQRAHSGDPLSNTFALNDGSGNPVDFSIDPYFFTFQASPSAVPEPATISIALSGGLILWLARRRRR